MGRAYNPANPMMSATFLEEYRSPTSILRYTRDTAGHGISYLLEEVYGNIYLEALASQIATEKIRTGVRVLEFGCGGGMNLLHLISIMARRGIHLERAYGTDFSEKMIE